MVQNMERREFVLSAGAAAAAGVTGCIGGNGEDGNETDGNGDNGDDNGDNGDSDFTLVEEEPDYEGYFDGCETYEDVGGTVDWTGEDSVTVMAGNDDYVNQFYPPAIKVDQGTTVTWEWGTAGHNVQRALEADGTTANERASEIDVDTGGDWEGDDSIENPPHTYEHTFESGGIHLYVCQPHDAERMYGAVIVEGGDGTDGDDGMDGNETDGNDTEE